MGKRQVKNNLIKIADNLLLILRSKNSPESKRRIAEASTKKIEINYTYLLLRGGTTIHLKTEEDIKKTWTKIALAQYLSL